MWSLAGFASSPFVNTTRRPSPCPYCAVVHASWSWHTPDAHLRAPDFASVFSLECCCASHLRARAPSRLPPTPHVVASSGRGRTAVTAEESNSAVPRPRLYPPALSTHQHKHSPGQLALTAETLAWWRGVRVVSSSEVTWRLALGPSPLKPTTHTQTQPQTIPITHEHNVQCVHIRHRQLERLEETLFETDSDSDWSWRDADGEEKR